MKSSSTDPKVASAYGYLITNLMVLPGMGTLLAGKKTEGISQIILSLIGVLCSIYGVFALIFDAYKYKSNITAVLTCEGIWILLAGCAIFLAGWVWSLCSGYFLIKNAKKDSSE